MNLEAAIFDLDGVIVDSEPLYHRACKEFFRRFGIDITKEEFIRQWMVESTASEGVINSFRIDYDPNKAKREIKELYQHYFSTELILVSGAEKLIKELHSNMKLGVVSSSLKNDINFILTTFGLTDLFDCVVSREDIKYPKPNPQPYTFASNQLGCNQGGIVVIEDAERGVIAAKDAGMKCIAVPNEYTKNMDFSRADLIVSGLEEINLKTLEGLYSQ
ncbi:MAG: HAD family phosphatase [Nanoarchaeota archaeon]|nr:HAD family phosphatase [Nanoarchaeota archaeon]